MIGRNRRPALLLEAPGRGLEPSMPRAITTNVRSINQCQRAKSWAALAPSSALFRPLAGFFRALARPPSTYALGSPRGSAHRRRPPRMPPHLIAAFPRAAAPIRRNGENEPPCPISDGLLDTGRRSRRVQLVERGSWNAVPARSPPPPANRACRAIRGAAAEQRSRAPRRCRAQPRCPPTRIDRPPPARQPGRRNAAAVPTATRPVVWPPATTDRDQPRGFEAAFCPRRPKLRRLHAGTRRWSQLLEARKTIIQCHPLEHFQNNIQCVSVRNPSNPVHHISTPPRKKPRHPAPTAPPPTHPPTTPRAPPSPTDDQVGFLSTQCDTAAGPTPLRAK